MPSVLTWRRLLTTASIFLILLLVACRPATEDGTADSLAPSPGIASSPIATESPTALPPTSTTLPTEPATEPPIEPPTVAPTESPSPIASPEPTATDPVAAGLSDLAITPEDVVLYPVPSIYAGDRVTFQLLPQVPQTLEVNGVTVSIQVDGQEVSNGALGRRNWNGQAEGVFAWVWDTTGLAGDHEIRVVLDPADAIRIGDENPDNNSAVLTVTVLSAAGMPKAETAAKWITSETSCCLVHVVSDTAAARDLPNLLTAVESAVQQASSRLAEPPNRKLDIYFIDRVVGQGGFAGSDMVVSYVDRRYAGGNLNELLVHEAVHVLDRQFAPQRIAFLAEGLAVWATGGHYKPEDLHRRAAALVAVGEYIPLAQIAGDFYPVQHEVGYLEAGAFVAYLVERNGWSTFRAFYSDVTADDGPTETAALEANLLAYYGLSLTDMEQEWLAYLQQQPPDEATISDLLTTIRYYDTMRRYQLAYDPTAYFLTAWLPHPTDVREDGNVADLTRRPRTEVNVTLEVMMEAADRALRAGNYASANVILDSVARVLDNDGLFIDPLSTNYLNIVRSAAQFGYEIQSVNIQGSDARAVATYKDTSRLTELGMTLRGQEWVILSH